MTSTIQYQKTIDLFHSWERDKAKEVAQGYRDQGYFARVVTKRKKNAKVGGTHIYLRIEIAPKAKVAA